jgi:hypothetical protein
MAPSDFSMEDVYSSGAQVSKVNQEVTLQCGDFESRYIEPADEADLSNISENGESQESMRHLSNTQSSDEKFPSLPGPTVELEADEIPIYSTKDVFTQHYSARLLESKKERMAPLEQIKQERSAVPVAVKTEKLETNPEPMQLAPAVEERKF